MKSVREQVAAAARMLHERGWVANHDGNITARDHGVLWATPTATSKRLIVAGSVLGLDDKGAVVSGKGRVFGEIGLHMEIYKQRSDIGAVVHAHPRHATAIACAGRNLLATPFLAEAVVSLGPSIPLLPFAMPGESARSALENWPATVDAVLLGNHGVLAWGADVEQALLRLELVEHLATIAWAAVPLGGTQPLPASAVQALLTARVKAGLGQAAEKADKTTSTYLSKESTIRPVVACAPAPHSEVPTVGISKAAVAEIVREEVRKLGPV